MGTNLFIALPLLHITSSPRSEEFYCEKLGFTLDSVSRGSDTPDPCFICLEREGVCLHLSSHAGDGIVGGVAGFGVHDVDALYAEFQSRGVAIAMPPTDQTWGNREMYVRDPDGNSLRFLQFKR